MKKGVFFMDEQEMKPPAPPRAGRWASAYADIQEQFVWDNELGLVLKRTQWFPGLLDAVKHLHNTGQQGTPDWRPLMHVPGVLIEDWCEKQRVTFDEFTRSPELRRQFLNDPALSSFRVWRGRV